jgi:hypothetical protein
MDVRNRRRKGVVVRREEWRRIEGTAVGVERYMRVFLEAWSDEMVGFATSTPEMARPVI